MRMSDDLIKGAGESSETTNATSQRFVAIATDTDSKMNDATKVNVAPEKTRRRCRFSETSSRSIFQVFGSTTQYYTARTHSQGLSTIGKL